MVAGADLSSSQFLAVKADTADGDAVLAGAGEMAVGILQNKPGNTEEATVAVAGIVKAKAGASVTQGTPVSVNASGKIVTATLASVDTSDGGAAADPVNGSYVLGIAMQSADADDVFSILLTHAGFWKATA